MAKIEPEMKNGLMAKGWTQQQVDKLWTDILDFAKYSFNKCCSGDTKLFDRTVTVRELYKQKFFGGALSMLNMDTVYINLIVDISFSGNREVYRVTTENGATMKCTDNHKFPTVYGDRQLFELEVGDRLYTMDKDYSISLSKIVSIEYVGIEDVYDIEMADPAHNFITDSGLVTCNSHAAAYALTAYISMYLKTHHAAEFYTACINSYAGDIEKIVLCIAEAKNAGVNVRFDLWYNIKATTTCKDGEIMLGIDTLRGFGSTASDALCQMYASNPQNFIDIISAAQGSSIDKTQFQALITLGMFKEYGKTGKLLTMNELYQSIYKAKVFSKNKLPVDEALIRQCARETKSQYRDIDNAKLFALACADIEDAELSLSQLLTAEIKYKGYVDYNDSKLKKYYLVLDMNTKYSPKMKLYSLADGSVKVYKTYKTNYEKQPFNKGAIIKVLSEKPRSKTQMVDGKWQKIIGEYEDWITNYKVKGEVEIE